MLRIPGMLHCEKVVIWELMKLVSYGIGMEEFVKDNEVFQKPTEFFRRMFRCVTEPICLLPLILYVVHMHLCNTAI